MHCEINKKLKVAIAGFGVVGRTRYRFIQENPYFHTVAVSDVRFDEKVFHDTSVKILSVEHVKIFSDYKRLFSEEFDVLFVSLPNYLAPDATIKGLENGCHVFCEKPPGRNVQDIKNVIEVEETLPKLKLKYGFNHRYHGSVGDAKKIIDSEELGKVLVFRGLYGKSRIVPFEGGWRCERRYAGGGILLDQGIHMLDLLRYFYDDFTTVKSFVSNDYWHHDVEDNAIAIFKDAKGRIATVHSSATQWSHRFRLEIALHEGFLELSGILSDSKSYGEEKLKIISRKDDSIRGSQEEKVISYLEDNSWKEEVDEFAEIIINDTPVENGNSSDALKVMKMVYQIYYADETWRKKFNIEDPGQ